MLRSDFHIAAIFVKFPMTHNDHYEVGGHFVGTSLFWTSTSLWFLWTRLNWEKNQDGRYMIIIRRNNVFKLRRKFISP